MGDTPDYDRQPPPRVVANAVSAHDLVRQDVHRQLRDWSSENALSDDLLERRQYGLRKYGVVLHVNNGRDHMQDAYDEVLDLLVYSKMMMAEDSDLADGDFYTDYLHLLQFAGRIRFLLSNRVLV